MITESPLKCSINNEHKSKSWLKCSIPPPPLAVTTRTHTHTHTHVYSRSGTVQKVFAVPAAAVATVIVAASHMAIQRLSIVCMCVIQYYIVSPLTRVQC